MPRMTPSEAFVETLVAHGVTERLRHRRLGLHGRARPVSARRHPLHPGRARAGRGPHGRRLFARHRAATACASRRTAPASPTSSPPTAAAYWAHSPVVVITPETGSSTHRASAASRKPSSCRSSRRSPSTRRMSTTPRAWPSSPRAASTVAMLEIGPTQLNIPRDYFYGEIDCEIPQADRSRARRRAPRRASTRRPSCWPRPSSR